MKSKGKDQEKYYQFWLHNLPGVGDRTIRKLIGAFGSEKAVYEADEKKLGQVIAKEEVRQGILRFSAGWDLHKAYDRLKEQGIGFLTDQDEDYPSRLRKLKHPPYGLYYLGNLPKEDAMAAAIIGARECSEYGRYMAEAFAGRLAGAGVVVVSGMARGIDGIAQQAAVSSGGETFAVLGSGVDVCYPASNRLLYEEILHKGGGILSVFPPGEKPQKRYFPERNRIVAGLSDLLLVVEARQKSGTWITVDMALEQGKNVYAVPGRLTDRLSDGCNLLIRQGAGIALSPDDLLQEICVLKNRQGNAGGHFGNGSRCTLPGSVDRDEAHMKGTHTGQQEGKGKGWQMKQLPGDGHIGQQDGKGKEWQVEQLPGDRYAGQQADGQTEQREKGILPFLDFTPQTADEILSRMQEKGENTHIAEVLAGLTELCVEGKAKQAGGCYYLQKTVTVQPKTLYGKPQK